MAFKKVAEELQNKRRKDMLNEAEARKGDVRVVVYATLHRLLIIYFRHIVLCRSEWIENRLRRVVVTDVWF